MLNSYARSSANSSSSSGVSVSNVGNTINFSPIIRTNAEAKFKKVKVNSLEFDLMTSEKPSIVNEQITKLESYFSHTERYAYSIQEIQVLSFNPIQIDTMLVEYLLIGEPDKQTIEIWSPTRGEYAKTLSKNEIFEKIFEKLLTKIK